MAHKLQILALIQVLLAVVAFGQNQGFSEWDPIHWVVPSTNQIQLPCYHPKYYPFLNVSLSQKKVVWITPEATSYQHLSPEETTEGWSVHGASDNYTLVIDKENMNVPDAVNGMYVCAVLANIQPWNTTSNVYSWYYLRWGVGLYTNVPAMNPGSIGEKYYWCFTYAWVACLVAIVIIILFAVAIQCRYKGGPVEESEIEEVGIDGLSIEDEKETPRRKYSTDYTM